MTQELPAGDCSKCHFLIYVIDEDGELTAPEQCPRCGTEFTPFERTMFETCAYNLHRL